MPQTLPQKPDQDRPPSYQEATLTLALMGLLPRGSSDGHRVIDKAALADPASARAVRVVVAHDLAQSTATGRDHLIELRDQHDPKQSLGLQIHASQDWLGRSHTALTVGHLKDRGVALNVTDKAGMIRWNPAGLQHLDVESGGPDGPGTVASLGTLYLDRWVRHAQTPDHELTAVHAR